MNSPSSPRGLLVINLGTPSSPSPADVKTYLAEFLMDPFVIDIPWFFRWALVKGVILNTRPKKSAEAYKSVWRKEGSPLMIESENFMSAFKKLAHAKLPYQEILLAMRYGNPNIKEALAKFQQKGIRRITIFALYPQYAESSTRTAIEQVHNVAKEWENFFDFDVVPAFYNHIGFSNALAKVTIESLAEVNYDHFLMTFHGLPMSHLLKVANNKDHCFRTANCCAEISTANQHCYRAQCFHTAQNLATALKIPKEKWSISFQSRLGPKWITPFTDVEIPKLAKQGIKTLAVVSPAFVSDCLETVEELGIRGKELFTEAGGKNFQLVPCLNSHPAWIEGAIAIVSDHLARSAKYSAFPFVSN